MNETASYHSQAQGLKETTARTTENPGGNVPNDLTSTCRFIPFQHRNTSQPFSKQTPEETRSWIVQVCKQVSVN